MFLPPVDHGPPPALSAPRPSRRKSMKLPWSLSSKSRKLKNQQSAMVAEGEEQRPVSPQQSVVDSYDDSEKQADTEYGSEAATDTQDQPAIDSRSASAYSTDNVTLSDANTDQAELSHADDIEYSQDDDTQTVADDAGHDSDATATDEPAVAQSEAANAAAQTPKAPKQKGSLSESIKYDENGNPVFDIQYTPAQVQLIASEIYNQTIAETTLVLFVDWIRAEPENFEMATKYIRELATDRGYKVERTNNPHLCELVRQVNDMRPKEVRSPVICEQAPIIRSQKSYYAICDPEDECTFADPKSKDLPVALRQMRQRVVYPSYLSSPLSSPSGEFPPDTPDRPQPLSLRSRTSGASHMTPTAYRSASAPLGSSPDDFNNRVMLSPIKFPRGSLILEETASHPLLAAPAESEKAFSIQSGNDDVFGIANNQGMSRSAPNTAREGSCYSGPETARRYASTCHQHQYAQGPYALSPSDAGDESDGFESASIVEDTCSEVDVEDGATFRDDESDLHTYTGSDGTSILYPPSLADTETGRGDYTYDNAPVPSQAALSEIAAKRGARQARKKISGPAPATFVSNFHRPLPLRSYESEAHLFPTTGAQGGSTHNRAQSAGSLIRGNRPVSLAIDSTPPTVPQQSVQLPVRSSSVRTNTIPLPAQPESLRDHSRLSSGHSRLSSRIDEAPEFDIHAPNSVLDSSTGQRTTRGTSLALTLNDFPVAPMHNPVGALPMTVQHAISTAANPVASLLDACTIVTAQAARIKALLEQTRDRGESLPVANWERMSTFERSWRSDREELLIAIYGRHDTWLGEEDVEYVDLIWMELRASPEAAWVLDLFQCAGDEEMF